MALNHYFNNFPKYPTSEQNLVEDLVIEALKIYSMDVYYLPRTSQDIVDYLYGEDALKQYNTSHVIEMYLENVNAMEGQGDFISRFGLEIRDECSLLVSRKRFLKEVPELIRPREGDIIYIPLVQNFFEITFVEHENNQAMFYTLGKGRGANVYVYALKLKQYTFSNEIIHTGVEEIDDQIRDNYSKLRLNISGVSGVFTKDELIYQGATYANRTAEAYVYNQQNSYIDVYRTIGEFSNTGITGNTSGATANVTLEMSITEVDTTLEELVDNLRIETESDRIINWNVENPFGDD